MVEVRPLALDGVFEIAPRVFEDERGSFSETYSARDLAAAGVTATFVQDNHSVSLRAGVVRGLHFQKPPAAQAKLVRVVRGAIFDVAVDIRAGSPTFGQWVGLALSAANRRQLFVPAGFAHGFMTTEPDTEVIYKVTDYYAPAQDAAIRFDDPAIGIDWPLDPAGAILSARDAAAPLLGAIDTGFVYR